MYSTRDRSGFHASTGAARLFVVAILLLTTLIATGQPIRQPPPPITFPEWKEIELGEEHTEYLVTIPSAYRSPYPNNNQIPVRVFIPEPRTGPIPVVVVLHYWGATDLRPERALATELNRRGMAAAVVTLPYHLERTPPGRRSGEMAIEGDVERLKLTTLQSVSDVRRTIDFLSTKPEFDPKRVGITGTSLGALVTALVFALDPRVDSATFILGGVDFADILWSSSRVVIQRDVLRRRGFTEERLREALAEVEPLTYLPERKTGSAFVIGAKFDTVIPESSSRKLIAALPDPKVLWLDTGHYGGIFVQRRLMREVAGYFASKFTGATYNLPTKLYAPTFRVGIKADLSSGFDVALGLDLIRFDPKGEAFGTLLVTPRGPGLFLGKKITPVIAAGAIFTPRSGSIGIFWSTVL
ncbi:MAG TPA: dienelactone hydrolase family protein [Fimbriimonas sp.]|nr:dienelactone hydrolase family protein [Fimbriimonas sp.]